MAGNTPQKIQQKANQATDRVAAQAQSSFENARSKVTEQVNAVARAVESAANTLKEQDQGGLSNRVQPYVQKIDSASRYLANKSPRELKEDLDDFARERPAWFLGGAFLLGVLAARFLKSSAESSDDKAQIGTVEYARA